MDMSLFKETLKRHSIRLKEDAIEAEFNDAIIKATYYSENAMAKVDNVIKTFKEKASNGCTDVLYAEGIKDIGRAIWSAIINFGKAIVRIAINIKMMFIGGEKGLIKRLAVIKDKVKDINGDIDAKLPVLKGKKGLGGFDDLITVLLDLASGDAYLSAKLTSNGELVWNPNEKDTVKLERADALNQILSMHTFGKDYMSKIARRIKQDGSLVDVFAAPARVYDSMFTEDGKTAKTIVGATMGNDADVDAIEKYTNAVRSGVAKKGINAQLMKSIGSTDGKLKSAVSYETMQGLDKRTVVTTIDNIATSIQTVFKASTKGDARKGIGTTLNFEDCMRVVIKDTTKVMKSLNKTGKTIDNAEAATRVQNISKASATVMNVVLRDYTNMAGDIKLILHSVVKQMSTGIGESGKSTGTTGKKITSIPYFKDAVDKKDKFAVKSVLADMIARIKGDKNELDDAISYAESKGAFEWDVHDKKEATTKWDNKGEEYNFEKERLVQNFSKERYVRVLKLYAEYKGGTPSTSTAKVKPVKLDVNMTDSFSVFHSMAGGKQNEIHP